MLRRNLPWIGARRKKCETNVAFAPMVTLHGARTQTGICGTASVTIDWEKLTFEIQYPLVDGDSMIGFDWSLQ